MRILVLEYFVVVHNGIMTQANGHGLKEKQNIKQRFNEA